MGLSKDVLIALTSGGFVGLIGLIGTWMTLNSQAKRHKREIQKEYGLFRYQKKLNALQELCTALNQIISQLKILTSVYESYLYGTGETALNQVYTELLEKELDNNLIQGLMDKNALFIEPSKHVRRLESALNKFDELDSDLNNEEDETVLKAYVEVYYASIALLKQFQLESKTIEVLLS